MSQDDAATIPKASPRSLSKANGLSTLQSLIDALPHSVLVVDSKSTIRCANRAAKQLFGHQSTRVERALQDLLATPADIPIETFSHPLELSCRHPTGRTFPASITLSEIPRLKPTHYFATFTDLSETRLYHEQIRELEARLETANDNLEQFVHFASHDLQEPLRMVASFTELTARRYGSALDDTGREFIGYAVEGTRRMKSMVSGLLRYATIDTDSSTWQEIDPNKVFTDVFSKLAPIHLAEHAELNIPDPLPTVTVIKRQFHELAYQLIDNAIKFRAGDKTPVIRIQAARRSSAWEFSVQDNGIGIAPDFHARAFIVFGRINRSRRYPGNGVGLALCKKIVARHGGEIWCDSAVGKGATFYFSIEKRHAIGF